MKITIKDIQESSSPLQLFHAGCKSEETFKHYTTYLRKFVFEFLEEVLKSDGYEARVNELISKAKSEPGWIKQIMFATIQQLRKKTELDPANPEYIKPRTIYNTRNAIKKLFDMNEIALVWKKIDSMMPDAVRTEDSRGWMRAEIKKMLNHASSQDSCAIYIASSSGIRLGGFDFLWGDLKPVYLYENRFLFETFDVTESVERDGKIVCGLIRVYGTAKESYYAFITPEAYNSVLEYKQTWIQKSGAEPRETDPFFVSKIRIKKQEVFIPLTSSGLKSRLHRIAVAVGFRKPLTKGKRRHNVPMMNGFRRYFNKSIKESKSRDSTLAELIKKERMMGHETGLILLDANYFKTHVSELIEEYLQVVPNLTISDSERQKSVIKKQEKKIRELQKKDDRIEELEYIVKKASQDTNQKFKDFVDIVEGLYDAEGRMASKKMKKMGADWTKKYNPSEK